MDILLHFYENRYLFKCQQYQFNEKIKTTLTKILLDDAQKLKNKLSRALCVDNHNGAKSCMICHQCIIDNCNFIICDGCCYLCIEKNVIIVIIPSVYDGGRMICYKSTEGYVPVSYDIFHDYFSNLVSKKYQGRKEEVLKLFVDNS